MYDIDGVDLSRSQFEELVHVRGYGGEGRRTYVPVHGLGACDDLSALGLVDFKVDSDGMPDEAWLTRKGRDWLASYDYSVRKARRATFREVLLAVWSVVGGAAAGGLVTYLLFKLYGID